jgi:hypothetical protein
MGYEVKAGHGWARRGMAWRGRAGQGEARRGAVWPNEHPANPAAQKVESHGVEKLNRKIRKSSPC